MRPPRRKAPVRRGTQPVPALERQPRGPQHLGPAAAERQSPGSVTPSPAWPPVIATPSVGVPFHRTSEYLRSKSLKARLARRVFPAHSLEGVAALHNYLASILTRFPPDRSQAIPVSAQVSDVQTLRRPALCQES